MNVDCKAFCSRIHYEFQHPSLLENALTHSSYAYENRDLSSNERLEFLGDAVLSLVISERLYSDHPDLPEGELSKIRSRIVCEETLSKHARSLGIGENLLLGKGEEQMGGRDKDSLLADAFEALLAAIFLDGGIGAARSWALAVLEESIALAVEGKIFTDYKSDLQEAVQKQPKAHLQYILEKAEGPDHDKKFTVKVLLGGQEIGEGVGKSKKEAEQSAARSALNGKRFSQKA